MNHLKIILFVSFLFFFNITFGQIIKNGSGKVNNETFLYSYIEPAQNIKGVLILLPGWGESIQSVY
jgi:hypothetical protein